MTTTLADAAAAALVGAPWTAADTPALLVDLDRLERNIQGMAALAREHGLDLRPHFKTHKSVQLARRQMAAGAVGMTVAKLDEAEVLIQAGIGDVLLAFELVAAPKLQRAMALAARARLTLAVDGIDGGRAIAGAAAAAGIRVPVSIEIDCGLRRCGVRPAEAAALASALAVLPGIAVDGVFTHAGHAYAATSREQIEAIAADEAAAVREAAERIRASGLALRVVSVGSTPTAAAVARAPGITELRAGNYIFYDAMQIALGTIPADRPALTIGAVVVSRPIPERAVIDAGSKTFGLDKGAHGLTVVNSYGRPIDFEGSLDRLSEEHGMFTVAADSAVAVGDHVQIIPNHACAVGNLGRAYLGIRDGIVEEIFSVDAAAGVH